MKNWWQRHKIFLVVWLTMFSSVSVQGQTAGNMGKNNDFMNLVLPGNVGYQMAGNAVHPGLSLQKPIESLSVFSIKQDKAPRVIIPSDIFYRQSGMMCKLEWNLEKKSHIPFRFRLGSLADCNAMEGKR